MPDLARKRAGCARELDAVGLMKEPEYERKIQLPPDAAAVEQDCCFRRHRRRFLLLVFSMSWKVFSCCWHLRNGLPIRLWQGIWHVALDRRPNRRRTFECSGIATPVGAAEACGRLALPRTRAFDSIRRGIRRRCPWSTCVLVPVCRRDGRPGYFRVHAPHAWQAVWRVSGHDVVEGTFNVHRVVRRPEVVGPRAKGSGKWNL